MPDYQRLWSHVAALPVAVLITTGRTGSDFLQSLFDGHPQVLMLPGSFYWHEFYAEGGSWRDAAAVAEAFTKAYPGMFDSRQLPRERWDRLGANRDEWFTVDPVAFTGHFAAALAGRELNARSAFIAVHLAYALAAGDDIGSMRLLWYHLHHYYRLPAFARDFPQASVMLTVRNPKNTLACGIDHWRAYDPVTFEPVTFVDYLQRIMLECELVLPHCRTVRALKLEALHLDSATVLRDICGTYGLDFVPSLLRSTWRGKQWWGDALSPRFLDGFNRNIETPRWRPGLSRLDAFVLDALLLPRLRRYRYPEGRGTRLKTLLALPLLFLPMRYEAAILRARMTLDRSRRTAVRKSLRYWRRRVRTDLHV
ncbi:MAG TPA: sulfotransferase, partial [bacterium]|nr:sulfotransferase [bacterium]